MTTCKSQLANPGWFLVTPSVALLLLWMIVPLGMTVYFSQIRYNLLNPGENEFVGLENFEYFITDSGFMPGALNTLLLVGIVLLISVVFGVLIFKNLIFHPVSGILAALWKLTLADKVVVLNGGRIEQVGSPLELYHQPANLFVAGFLGTPKMAFLKACVVGTSPHGVEIKLASGAQLLIPRACGSFTGRP